MDLYNEQLMYEFHAKDFSHAESLKQYADHAVKEIKSARLAVLAFAVTVTVGVTLATETV